MPATKTLKPTVGAQVESTEKDDLNTIRKDSGRSESYLVRAGVRLIIEAVHSGKWDLSKSIDANMESVQ